MLSSLHKVSCPVGCIIVVVGCPHVFWFFAICVLLMCRGLQIKATFYDFSSLFAHLLTMFSCCISFRRAKMVIIGGDAGGNEGDVFLFTFFLLFLSCFSTYACMIMSFFSCFLLVA